MPKLPLFVKRWLTIPGDIAAIKKALWAIQDLLEEQREAALAEDFNQMMEEVFGKDFNKKSPGGSSMTN